MNHYRILSYLLLSLGLQVAIPAEAQEQKLSLQEAITLALEHNRSLKISKLSVSQAEQQTRISRGKFLPSLNLGGQYAHYFDRPVFFGLGGPAQGDDELSYARI